jgi:hypothetical protein
MKMDPNKSHKKLFVQVAKKVLKLAASNTKSPLSRNFVPPFP